MLYFKINQQISPILLCKLSFKIFKAILIIFQVVSNASHVSNDFSTTPNLNNNIENDTEVISFDVTCPSPSYPIGGEFGKGFIDLGGLKVHEAVYFKKIWEIHSGGPDGMGVSFYEPASIPYGFYLLGHYSKPNSMPFFASVLTAKDATGDRVLAIQSPIDYTLVWTSKGLNISKYEDGYIWTPIPPAGYKAIGHIVTNSSEKPSLDKVMCVRSDFTDLIMVDKWIWGLKTWWSSLSINLYTTKPVSTALNVPAGTFLARTDDSNQHELACLKMVRSDPYSAMPNSLQLKTMIQSYAPLVYLHPDEQYFPSSVSWFFQNGAELHQTGRIPWPVFNDGVNLPNDVSEDDAFLDLPPGDKDRVKKGFLPNATAYIHVKPALGAIYTDLAIWLYYPFNGGGKFQLGPFTINLGKIGEHVSDWEHMTLRIDNFRGSLKAIYLSQHSAGKWVTPEEFDFFNVSRPVVYASLHGHSHYNTPSYHLHSTVEIDSSDMEVIYDALKMDSSKLPIVKGEKFLGFGVRDDAEKSDNFMDIASSYQVVCVDYKASKMEPWLNFTGRWGPKFNYKFTNEVLKITDRFPKKLKALVIRILHKLPAELLGQEGPEGPRMRESWTGDEIVI